MKHQASSQCRLQARQTLRARTARTFGRLTGAHRQEAVRAPSPQMAIQEALSFPASPTERLWKIQWVALTETPQVSQGFSGGSVVKNPPANAGDMDSIPGLGRPSGEGNDNPLQHSCLGNPMDRGAWWAIVHGITESRTWLGNWHAC